MSKKIQDGGPAFPWQWVDRDSVGEMTVRKSYPGMSLRDWFAGMALQALIALDTSVSISDSVRDAYLYADRMIEVREGGA